MYNSVCRKWTFEFCFLFSQVNKCCYFRVGLGTDVFILFPASLHALLSPSKVSEMPLERVPAPSSPQPPVLVSIIHNSYNCLNSLSILRQNYSVRCVCIANTRCGCTKCHDYFWISVYASIFHCFDAHFHTHEKLCTANTLPWQSPGGSFHCLGRALHASFLMI